jgi:protein ImuB
MKTKKYLSLYLPTWSIDLVQRKLIQKQKIRPGFSNTDKIKPILLVSKSSNQLTVKRFCSLSEKSGITEDMPLTLAKALLPGAYVEEFNPQKDFEALLKLSKRALRFTPLSGIDNLLWEASHKSRLNQISPLYNGLILDMTGTEKLYRNKKQPEDQILEALARAGIGARIGISATIGAAWAFSRYTAGRITIVSGKNIQSALEPLPVSALRIRPETESYLCELGIYKLEDLFRLSKKSLLKRFGYEILKRMDQALGYIEENLNATHLNPAFSAKADFETPLIRYRDIKSVILDLLKEVFNQLNDLKKKSGSFTIILQGLNSDFSTLTVKKEIALNTATNSFPHISSVVQPILESLQSNRGIVSIHIEGEQIENVGYSQKDFIAGSELIDVRRLSQELLNTLVVRLGKERIRKIKFYQSHIPEKSFSYSAINKAEKNPEAAFSFNPHSVKTRPFYILTQPELVTVIALLPDRPPAWIKWRSESFRIVRGLGPERISAEWWLQTAGTETGERDYFKILDQNGRWLWIFRDKLSGQWFLHGVWA